MQINQATFTAVVESAKTKTVNDPKWLRAIEKAAKAILSGEMIVTTLRHGALVTTANGTYAANGHCNCEAARRGHSQCYHRAAARLMDLYEAEMAAEATFTQDVAESSRENLIIEIRNIWDRVESTPLADALMARFGVNYLEALSIDFLQAIRIALA